MTGEYYDIDTGAEPGIVEYPNKLETGGISTCTGVAILNHKTKKGYLGHYIPQDTSSEYLIDRAIKESSNINDLEVMVAGNLPLSRNDVLEFGYDFDEVSELSNKHGRWTIEMIKSKGIKLKKIKSYLQETPGEYYYNMTVDTEVKKIEIEKINIS